MLEKSNSQFFNAWFVVHLLNYAHSLTFSAFLLLQEAAIRQTSETISSSNKSLLIFTQEKILCYGYLGVPLNTKTYLLPVNHDQLLKMTPSQQCSLSPGKYQQFNKHKEMYKFKINYSSYTGKSRLLSSMYHFSQNAYLIDNSLCT